MDNFTWFNPTRLFFGKGEENHVGDRVRRLGCKKVLVHYGSASAVKSGLIYRVTASLERAGITAVSLGGVRPNPRSGLVHEGIELCRKEEVDFILAVGGGSVIDSAKAIALGVPYKGDFWDFFEGKAFPSSALPVGTILTIAASGSESSPVTVITREDGMFKRPYSSDRIRPVLSILNPELTLSLPPLPTAGGATDIMSHVLERYFTNTKGVELTDRLCESILLTVKNELPLALQHPDDYDHRANLMLAGTLAHNDICGIGREQDWATHALAHELSARYDAPHGATLAVIFPAWMEYVMDHDVNRFAQIAVRVWGCDMDYQHPDITARYGIRAFRAFLKMVGMPTSFAGIRARVDDIPQLLDQLQIGNSTIGSFVKLDRSDCEKIYKLACREPYDDM